MAAGVALTGAYCVYALGRTAPAAADVAAWARVLLCFIGIAVVATIVIQIIFHVLYSVSIAVKEQELSDKEVERIIAADAGEDEMDKLIGLKASRFGYACAGIGALGSLFFLGFFGTSTVVVLHILLGACCVGSFVEGCVGIWLYERGVANG